MISFLLDTQIYLWLVSGDERLPDKATSLLTRADAIYVSSATLWEIAIKVRIGKLKADVEEMVNDLEPSGYRELPIYPYHAIGVAKLPMLHSDPFDRLLVAQAITENMWLLTADKHLPQYTKLVIRV
jgi:PIN domain nuclease of toxin-antitoxin system